MHKKCKYEKCNKPLNEETKKVYCTNTDCYYKQNQIDAKRKRDAKKRVLEVRECKACGVTFTAAFLANRQMYCTKACQKLNAKKSCACGTLIDKCHNKCIECHTIHKREAPIALTRKKVKYSHKPPSYTLVRGPIQYRGHATTL